MFSNFLNRANKSSQMSEVADVDTSTTYMLKKRRPGCTGMFWRSDPTGQTKCTKTSENWPRDNALVRGVPITIDTTNTKEQWLLASSVKQCNSDQWIPAPPGAALPFEYDNHYYLEKIE